jgi:ABC-type microcin C transport system duplicated ATPase subunit YejF
MTAPLVELEHVRVTFRSRGRPRHPSHDIFALEDADVTVRAGESLGIVGESGSGKSTLARVMLGLLRPESGQVRWGGAAIDPLDRRRMREVRRGMQPVFQDPVGSLDPRMTVRECIAEALEALEDLRDRSSVETRVGTALRDVALDPALASRYPHQLSGGQCQRVAIARAMVARPNLLICDEAVSALDVSVQAQIVNLLRDLHRTTGVALVFISHNIAVVRALCDRVIVLERGRIVEQGETGRLFATPTEQYTRTLIAAVPRLRLAREN